jgi:hypothetical protein
MRTFLLFSALSLYIVMPVASFAESDGLRSSGASVSRMNQLLRLAQNCPQLAICQNTLNQCGSTCNNMVNTINGDKQAWLNNCIGNCRNQYNGCYKYQTANCR